MKHEYHEGPKAGENFKALATAVFQAKKTTVPPKAETEEDSATQGFRQGQGLEGFLLPRPCLRVAHANLFLAGQFGIGETLASNLRHERARSGQRR